MYEYQGEHEDHLHQWLTYSTGAVICLHCQISLIQWTSWVQKEIARKQKMEQQYKALAQRIAESAIVVFMNDEYNFTYLGIYGEEAQKVLTMARELVEGEREIQEQIAYRMA